MITIEARDLTFDYVPGERVLNQLNFRIPGSALGASGQVVAIMGASGCGKSTLLRLLAGLETPTKGDLEIAPTPGTIPYLTQEAVLLPQYSRLKNARYRSFAGSHRQHFNAQTFEQLKSTLRLDDSFLSDAAGLHAMSGGQRQRLALLRDLSVSPDLLLLDEPCNGLDQPLKVEFLQQLRQLVEQHPALVIYVTHHWDEVQLAADHVAFLSEVDQGLTQRFDLSSVADALAQPPSLTAAQLMCYPVCNVVDCTVSETAGIELGRGNAKIAFPIDSVKFAHAGIPVERIAQTPSFAYVRIRPAVDIITLRQMPGSNVELSGHAWLFPDPAMKGMAIYLQKSNTNLCYKYRRLS